MKMPNENMKPLLPRFYTSINSCSKANIMFPFTSLHYWHAYQQIYTQRSQSTYFHSPSVTR